MNVPDYQTMGELSVVKACELQGPGSGTLHWSAPDSGALFDMDVEDLRKASVFESDFKEPMDADPLDEAIFQEDRSFPPVKPFEYGDAGDSKPKLGKIVHHKHHHCLLEKHSSYRNNPHALQTWQILEQRHTKSKSISVPKNRRSSSAF
jgi:hypothetical protein